MNNVITINSKKIVIEQNIFFYEIIMIEFRMTRAQKKFYFLIHHVFVKYFSKDVDKKIQENFMNIIVYRTLYHTIANDYLIIIKKRFNAKSDLNVFQLNI